MANSNRANMIAKPRTEAHPAAGGPAPRGSRGTADLRTGGGQHGRRAFNANASMALASNVNDPSKKVSNY
jgi:hypothetical protein